MLRRRISAAAVSATVALSVLTATAPAGADPVAAAGIRAAGTPGIAAGGNLQYLSVTAQEAALRGMEEAHVQWVRFDLEWKYVQQGGPTSWTWGAYQQLIPAIIRHHMTPLAILGKTPDWAKGSCTVVPADSCPPATDADFAAFARAAVTKYKSQVKYWEIWNEPNNTAAWATPNPERYGRLLVATSDAIRKADAGAFILTGGLAPVSTDDGNIDEVQFLKRVYTVAGVKAAFDAVAAHPYAFPRGLRDVAPDSGWSQLSETSPSLRSVMRDNNDQDTKIWLTEFGAPTGGDRAVSEVKQAQYVQAAFNLVRGYAWAGPLFIFTWQDTDEPPDYTEEGSFGLLRLNGSHKPAYDAFVAAAR